MVRAFCSLGLCISFACAQQAAFDTAAFDTAAFDRDLHAIVPAGDELGWKSLPWQTELRSAMLAASAQHKPVLLWAMNGHPLGQT
jgi:hypothetical protein